MIIRIPQYLNLLDLLKLTNLGTYKLTKEKYLWTNASVSSVGV